MLTVAEKDRLNGHVVDVEEGRGDDVAENDKQLWKTTKQLVKKSKTQFTNNKLTAKGAQ